MIKVGSDFSGVGAFDQALIRLGINYETVFACDMDKYARQTFIHNYGELKYYPENVYNREIPSDSLDIYMTSPPCQAFSFAGKRLGKNDKRGILFFNSHEFIQVNKPRYFIFENVKGLLSDDNGKTFQEWVNYLGGKSVNGAPIIFPYENSVPYHLYWKVLNAKHFGVPQNRERVFLIGIRDDADNNFQFPKEFHLIKRLKDVLEHKVDEKYFLSEKMINCLVNHKSDKFKINTPIINETDISRTLRTEMAKMGRQIWIADYRNDEGLRIRKDNISPCIISTMAPIIGYDYKIRRLTPRECFRLMDFPDSFSWLCSDSQAYKQAGNSIVVNVLYKIIKNLPL
jgi:DNA (cytosine-5)-methyltransferase 1